MRGCGDVVRKLADALRDDSLFPSDLRDGRRDQEDRAGRSRRTTTPIPIRPSVKERAEDGSGTFWIVDVNVPAPPVVGMTTPAEATRKVWPPPLASTLARKTPQVTKV